MKKFEFDHARKQWDRHRSFHADKGPFTEFETGEVMVTRLVAPHQRRLYDRYGIELVTTADPQCPPLYYDKACTQQVKRAWLNQSGQQHMAIDHEQRVAVRLWGNWRRDKEKVSYLGSHVYSAMALWTGPERLPVPLGQFVVSTPDRKVKADLRKKLAAVRAAAVAVARIKGLGAFFGDDKLACDPSWADRTAEDLSAYVLSQDVWVRIAAFNGFSYPRAETRHDFLYVK
jgi:hypothetical protein